MARASAARDLVHIDRHDHAALKVMLFDVEDYARRASRV
jgi:hypothetical protein